MRYLTRNAVMSLLGWGITSTGGPTWVWWPLGVAMAVNAVAAALTLARRGEATVSGE